ncbi:MAG: YihY/virulence factor BrkB family protein [Gaiellaceae bacterium]
MRLSKQEKGPRVTGPSLGDLTFADWKAIFIRAAKGFVNDNATLLASALAYSSFFAIPSVLLMTVGVFTLVAGPGTIANLMAHFSTVMPGQATELLGSSLKNLDAHPASSLVMTVIGFVLALWSTTGAMNAYMLAINLAYDRKDKRSFIRKRVVALQMVAAIGFAFVLVAVLLIFGPQIEKTIASHLGAAAGGVLNVVWWIAQVPILLAGLLAAFATLLYLGPDVEHRTWRFLTPGSLVAAVMWIAISGLFAVYTSMFGSYNKTWGALSAVIVTLTWLWLSSTALLFGAEVNAELERSRELDHYFRVSAAGGTSSNAPSICSSRRKRSK